VLSLCPEAATDQRSEPSYTGMTTPYWPFLQKEQNKKQGREVFVGKQDKTFVLSIRRFFCKKNLEVMSGPSSPDELGDSPRYGEHVTLVPLLPGELF
jgi:hypothetical protein